MACFYFFKKTSIGGFNYLFIGFFHIVNTSLRINNNKRQLESIIITHTKGKNHTQTKNQNNLQFLMCMNKDSTH